MNLLRLVMHVVAIHNLDKGKESLAGALSTVLGVTVFEALKRLRAPGEGPLIVAVFAEEGPAVQLVAGLQAGGFKASVLAAEEIEAGGRARVIRRFSLGELELGVATNTGEGFSIPYKNIDLILRGTSISSDSTTETIKNRSMSPGRAVLSGGLMITKTTKTVREVTTEEREGFFNLYSADSPALVFRENGLVYDSLGPALRPSRSANFLYLIAELRRRCPQALYDERLLSRAGQAALLGPSLDPEKYLAVATALIAKVLRGRD